MKKIRATIVLFVISTSFFAASLPNKSEIIQQMKKVNDYWISSNPTPGNNQWARAAYFTGCMDFYKIYPSERYLNYMQKWAQNNNWSLNGGAFTRNADNQTCGQIYFDLFQINQEKDSSQITAIATSIRNMVNSEKADDWWWIDALYMGMPVFTRLGAYYNDTTYFTKMHSLYTNTKTERGLLNTNENLWYRDQSFDPPYLTPNGEFSYWSRGNGWVIAAHVRTLQYLPKTNAHRAEYIQTFTNMADALKLRQREDGFWNCSLDDPNDFGGPETSGTSFFTYSLAWGINNGILDSATYVPVVLKAWDALNTIAVKETGFVGYIQGVGSNPASSQPVNENSNADFGVGAYLLAGSEIAKMAIGEMPIPVNFNLINAVAVDKNTIHLNFNDKVEQTSATTIDNYTINNNISIESIGIGNNDSTVIIKVSNLQFDSYTISVQNIKNSNNQTIETGESVSFVYSGIINISASGYEANTSNTPDKTIDFDLNTRWSCEGSGQWILYDLGDTKKINSIELAFYNGASRFAYFKITLINGNDSIEVFNGSNSGTTNQLETYDTGGIEASKIRITGFGNNQSKWNSITEARINYDELNTSVPEIRKKDLKDFLRLFSENKEGYFITDLTGKVLFNQRNLTSENIFEEIDNQLQSGIYILSINNKTYKFAL